MKDKSVLIAIIIYCIIWLFNSFVLLVMYKWFIVPLGLPEINYFHACGLYSFVPLFTQLESGKPEFESRYDTVTMTIAEFLKPSSILIIGFLFNTLK